MVETMCMPQPSAVTKPPRRRRAEIDPIRNQRNTVIRMLGLAGWSPRQISDALSKPVGPAQVERILAGSRTSDDPDPDRDETHEYHGAEACEHCRIA